MSPKEIKEEILRLSREYSRQMHLQNLPGADREDDFVAGETPVPYAARTFTEDEVSAAVSSVLDFWLTLGEEGEAMENELAQYIGARRSLLVNSGSSANLLAFTALTSHKLPEEKRIFPGDEVITCAAGFLRPWRRSFKMARCPFFSTTIPRPRTRISVFWKKPILPARPRP